MNITLAKCTFVSLFGLCASFFGWSGWLVLMVIGCGVADWLTGSAAALKQGTWCSQVAREGIFGKMGMFMAVIAAGIFDVLVHLITRNLPGLQLPFSYETLLLPVVCIWYICTELGSLIENAGSLGAPIPEFLKKAIALLKNKTEE